MHGQDPFEQDDPSSRGLRHESRDSLYILAKIRVAGGVGAEPIRVRNLSSSGLMAEAAVLYAVGTQIIIELKSLPRVVGRVVWATEGRMGIAFNSEIDPRKARQSAQSAKDEVPGHVRPLSGRRPGLKLS